MRQYRYRHPLRCNTFVLDVTMDIEDLDFVTRDGCKWRIKVYFFLRIFENYDFRARLNVKVHENWNLSHTYSSANELKTGDTNIRDVRFAGADGKRCLVVLCLFWLFFP